MIDIGKIFEELSQKYDITTPKAKKLRKYLEKIKSEFLKDPQKPKYLYFITFFNINDPLDIHDYLVMARKPIDFEDLGRRYEKYYHIEWRSLNFDNETIKEVVEFMLQRGAEVID